ncbi:VWA domain-containing protein [Campylobacter sputorum]|uniref:VWA domain-containing protein n=1 Tax=Campylobacter sputorum TaxID=206 RepID=UPI00053BDE82|nr:VWA domain-containing protein [Campylobacter sputorum]
MNDLNLAFLIFLLEKRIFSILVVGRNGVGKSFFISKFKSEFTTTFLPLNTTNNQLDDFLSFDDALNGKFKLQKGILSRARDGILVIENCSLLDDNILRRVFNKNLKLFLTHNPDNPPLNQALVDKIDFCIYLDTTKSDKFDIINSNLLLNFKNNWNLYKQILLDAKNRLEKIAFDDNTLKECLKLTKNCSGYKAQRSIFLAARAYAALNADSQILSHHLKKVAKFCTLHRENKPKQQPQKNENNKDDKQDNNKQNNKNSLLNIKNPKSIQSFENAKKSGTKTKITKPKEEIIKAENEVFLRDFLLKKDNKKRSILGFRNATNTDKKIGRSIKIINKKNDDISIIGTLKVASIWQKFRNRKKSIVIESSDIRTRQRQAKSSYTIIVALDVSGSMGAIGRIKKAKEFCIGVLKNTYIKRENIAIIAFRGDKARIIVSPTRASLSIKTQLNALSTGGKTPLAAALKEIYLLTKNIKRREKDRRILTIIITDARANSQLDSSINNTTDEIKLWSSLIQKSGIESIVVDSEKKDFMAFDKAYELANFLDAKYLTINEF